MAPRDFDHRKVSRRLSYVLRHDPESVGVALDSAGWVDVAALLAGLRQHGLPLTRGELEDVVASSDRQRFAFDPTGTKIRANQGHSVPIDLGLDPVEPPDVLYHGTTSRFLDAILREGLRPQRRHHVHLSPDVATARAVVHVAAPLPSSGWTLPGCRSLVRRSTAPPTAFGSWRSCHPNFSGRSSRSAAARVVSRREATVSQSATARSARAYALSASTSIWRCSTP